MNHDSPIHVVGGGIAGLVAAITAAEGGASVVLHEAGPQLGGRARSGDGPYGVNLGPHVIYRGGALTRPAPHRRLPPGPGPPPGTPGSGRTPPAAPGRAP